MLHLSVHHCFLLGQCDLLVHDLHTRKASQAPKPLREFRYKALICMLAPDPQPALCSSPLACMLRLYASISSCISSCIFASC